MNSQILQQLIATLQTLLALLMGQLVAKEATMPPIANQQATVSIGSPNLGAMMPSPILGDTPSSSPVSDQVINDSVKQQVPISYFGGYDIKYSVDLQGNPGIFLCVNAGGMTCSRQSVTQKAEDPLTVFININGETLFANPNGNGFDQLKLDLSPSTTYQYILQEEDESYYGIASGTFVTLPNYPKGFPSLLYQG